MTVGSASYWLEPHGTVGRHGVEPPYPTPTQILSRIGGLLLIFLWIAAAADCLVDAMGP